MMGLIQVPKLLCIYLTLFSLASWSKQPNADENVRQVCSITRYKDFCIRSLAPYSKTTKTNHTAWARAGVSVALSEIKNTTRYLEKMNTTRTTVKGRMNHQAISDCVECFYNAKDSLHQSLSVLRELDKVTFDEQMADVMTWVSAALTEEDTCLDGFDEVVGREGKRRVKRQRGVKMVMERVRNCTYVTSNALALLNKLASKGI